MGLIPPLQDYYAVPTVSVIKVHPEVFCEDAVPQHPSTGNLNRSSMSGKYALYCDGVPSLTLPSPSSPSPPWWGRWGGLSAPDFILTLEMVREQYGRKANSALQEM